MKRKMIVIPVMIATVLLSSCGSTSSGAVKTEPPESKVEVQSQTVIEDSADSSAPANADSGSVKEAGTTDSSDKSDQSAQENKLIVDEDINVADVKDSKAAGMFKDFLLGNSTVSFNGEDVSLGDLVILNLDDTDYDIESQTLTDYLIEHVAISYVISEADQPTLYLEIMNVMIEGYIYQIRVNDKGLYVNSSLDTGWSDSLSVYSNGFVGVYHGMHLPSLEYYYDATDSLIDVVSGEGKAKLLIFGPRNYFDSDSDFKQALSDYESMAETVLVFEEDPVEEYSAQRDEVIGLAAEDDVIEWNTLPIVSFEE